MKTSLALSLHGRDWWKPFLIYWVIAIAIDAAQQLVGSHGAWGRAHPGLAVVVQLGLALVLWLFASGFNIVFLRILAPRLSVDGDSLAFRGKMGEFLWLNVAGILLSIVTVGVFLPWYARRAMDYLASRTSWRGSGFTFMGRGGRLFVLMLLGFWVPLIVLIVVISVPLALAAPGSMRHGPAGGAQLLTMLVTFLFVLYMLLVFVYLVYKWMVDFSWKEVRVRWKTRFWLSFGFVLGQALLCIVTVTVYWPAAFLNLYRYFTARTVFTRGETEIGHLAFEGQKGFGLLWGQFALGVITLGVYLPWAYGNVGRWLVGATVIERTDK